MDHSHHSPHTSHKDPGSKENYSKHEGHSTDDFRKRLLVSVLLTVPVLLLSPMIQKMIGAQFRFPGDILVLFFISTGIFLYGGSPFLRGAVSELRRKVPGMMTLISLAISVAYLYSAAVTFGLQGEVFYWELATLVDIMLLGHWIEMRSVMGASRAMEQLSRLIPDTAHLVHDGHVIDTRTSEIEEGNIILVKPGEKIPSDGIVIEGESSVNESMLTGESLPVSKKKGEKVIGGSLNEEGAIKVRVGGVGEKSYLSKMMRLVESAQASKSKTQQLADRAALWLTFIAVLAGASTFISWMILMGDAVFAIERAATVLIIACPHALGLAVPLVVSISTALSARNGLLIRNRTAFENARRVTTIVFDKTGTLTEGAFLLKNIQVLAEGYDENTVLALAASLESSSEHPIARVIVNEARRRGIAVSSSENFQALKGKGIEARIQGRKYIAGSPGYIASLGVHVPEEFKQHNQTVIFVVDADKNALVAAFALKDAIRPESFEAVKTLKQEGLELWMLTGDTETVAKAVADELGLDGYFAQVLPEQKQDKIRSLQSEGKYVAMVGDGINDAPALAAADVGIAIGAGTDVAIETADIILVNSNPKDIATLLRFGKATYRKMTQNLLWATGYNVVAIPLAAGVLYGAGILLSPALGAVLMSLSTIIVALNAKTLKVNA